MTDVSERAKTAVFHALLRPDDADRWDVAADAAEEAEWGSLVGLFHNLAGHARDSGCVVLRRSTIGLSAFRLLYRTAEEARFICVVEEKPLRIAGRTLGGVDGIAIYSSEYGPMGRGLRSSPSTVIAGLSSIALAPDDEVEPTYMAAVRMRVDRLTFSSATAARALVVRLSVNGRNFLTAPTPASLFMREGAFQNLEIDLLPGDVFATAIQNASQDTLEVRVAIAATQYGPLYQGVR